MNEQEIFERITSVEQSAKSAHHRIDEMGEFNKRITEMLVEMRYMRRDLNEIIERISDVEKRPSRRYNVIINAAITAVIAAAVSFLAK